MSVYADKKAGKLTGRWVAEVEVNGSRRKGRYATREEAEGAEDAFRLAKVLPDNMGHTAPLEPVQPSLTLSQLAKEYGGLIWEEQGTQVEQVARLERIAGWVQDPLVSEIDISTIDLMHKALRKNGVKPTTHNRYIAPLKKALDWAKRRKMIAEVPEFEWRKPGEGRTKGFTQAEERDLLALLPEPYRSLTIAAIDTGGRRSEMLGLSNVNIKDASGRSLQPLATGWLWFLKTKNGDDRKVYLTARARVALAVVFKMGMPTDCQLRWAWWKACEAMGRKNDPDFVFHTCRHSCASRLADRDLNIKLIMQWMGHRSIATTMKYIHTNPGQFQRAAEALENYSETVGERGGLGGGVGDTGGTQDVPQGNAELASV